MLIQATHNQRDTKAMVAHRNGSCGDFLGTMAIAAGASIGRANDANTNSAHMSRRGCRAWNNGGVSKGHGMPIDGKDGREVVEWYRAQQNMETWTEATV